MREGCDVRYEFTGGPMDGYGCVVEGDDFHPGRAYLVLIEGLPLYRSRGPVEDADPPVVRLDYLGPGRHDTRPADPDEYVVAW